MLLITPETTVATTLYILLYSPSQAARLVAMEWCLPRSSATWWTVLALGIPKGEGSVSAPPLTMGNNGQACVYIDKTPPGSLYHKVSPKVHSLVVNGCI